MESTHHTPNGYHELAEMQQRRISQNNGFLPATDSTEDKTIHLSFTKDINRYESTTDPVTRPDPGDSLTLDGRPVWRISGILKNGSSLPRDPAELQKNAIQNPIFGSSLDVFNSERVVLNPQNDEVHSGTLTSENGDSTIKKKVSFNEDVTYTAEESSGVVISLSAQNDDIKDSEEVDEEEEVECLEMDEEEEYRDVIMNDNRNNNLDMLGSDVSSTLPSEYIKGTVLRCNNAASPQNVIRQLSVDELEIRSRHLSVQSLAQSPPGTDQPGSEPGKDKQNREFRRLVCLVMVFVIVAFIGLMVLGTLYGIA